MKHKFMAAIILIFTSITVMADNIQPIYEVTQQQDGDLFAWILIVIGLAAIVTTIVCVIQTVKLILNNEAVVFLGYRDLVISIVFSVITVILFFTLLVTLTVDDLDRVWWPFIMFSLITACLLVVSIKQSLVANSLNRKKTFFVVVAKTVFSFLVVLCFLVTWLSILNLLSNTGPNGRRKSAGDFARDSLKAGFLIWCSKWAATCLLFLVKKNPLEDTVDGEPDSSDHHESKEAQSDSEIKIEHCYRAFGLKSGDSLDQVRKAWRNLVKVWHPDRLANNATIQHAAVERMKEINAAYEILEKHLAFTAS